MSGTRTGMGLGGWHISWQLLCQSSLPFQCLDSPPSCLVGQKRSIPETDSFFFFRFSRERNQSSTQFHRRRKQRTTPKYLRTWWFPCFFPIIHRALLHAWRSTVHYIHVIPLTRPQCFLSPVKKFGFSMVHSYILHSHFYIHILHSYTWI